MPASLRIELLPISVPDAIIFYTRILSFTLLGTKDERRYASIERDSIRIGLAQTDKSEYPELMRDNLDARREARAWPVGTEIVIEVDDAEEERNRVVRTAREIGEEWERGLGFEDLTWQGWGLRDFRVKDPDGYYVRITGRESELVQKGV